MSFDLEDDMDDVEEMTWMNETTTTPAPVSNITRHPYHFCPNYDLKPSTAVYILSGPFNLGIGVLGILINLATLIVLGKQHQFKATPKIIMMTLGVSDIVEIVNQWLFWGALKFFIPRTTKLGNFLFLNYHFYHPIYRSFLTFNRGLTLLMTIDRWFIVCRTLLANRWWTKKKVFWIIAGLALYSIVVNIPNIFEYAPKEKPCVDISTGEYRSYTILLAYGSLLGCNKYFIWIYLTVFHTVIVTILPCIVMVIFNGMTIRKLMKNKTTSRHRSSNGAVPADLSEKQRLNNGGIVNDGESADRGRQCASMAAATSLNGSTGGKTPPPRSLLRTHSQTPDVSRSITIMCVSVTMIFVVLQTPYIVHNIGSTMNYRIPSCADAYCKDMRKCDDIDRVNRFEERVKCFNSCRSKKKTVYESFAFISVMNICLMLNNSLNGCIYFCAGSAFRQKFYEIFMPWKRKSRKLRANMRDNDLSNSVGSTRVRTYSNSKSDSLKTLPSTSFLQTRPNNDKKVQIDGNDTPTLLID